MCRDEETIMNSGLWKDVSLKLKYIAINVIEIIAPRKR